MRTFWLACGFLAVACGLVGVFLPLVPTVPFMLLAAFAFSRSSPALHDWLVSHARFGPAIRDWRENGAIARRSKTLASIAMLAAFALAAAFGAPFPVLAIQLIVLAGVAVFIWTRPDGASRGD